MFGYYVFLYPTRTGGCKLACFLKDGWCVLCFMFLYLREKQSSNVFCINPKASLGFHPFLTSMLSVASWEAFGWFWLLAMAWVGSLGSFYNHHMWSDSNEKDANNWKITPIKLGKYHFDINLNLRNHYFLLIKVPEQDFITRKAFHTKLAVKWNMKCIKSLSNISVTVSILTLEKLQWRQN